MFNKQHVALFQCFMKIFCWKYCIHFQFKEAYCVGSISLCSAFYRSTLLLLCYPLIDTRTSACTSCVWVLQIVMLVLKAKWRNMSRQKCHCLVREEWSYKRQIFACSRIRTQVIQCSWPTTQLTTPCQLPILDHTPKGFLL